MFVWKLVCEEDEINPYVDGIYVLIVVCVEVSVWAPAKLASLAELDVLILICVEVSVWVDGTFKYEFQDLGLNPYLCGS